LRRELQGNLACRKSYGVKEPILRIKGKYGKEVRLL
jgi:hypothetical protein